ncbi:MAG TPA: ANTAR domain-containing protein [Candidatus Eisenbergiella merdipullorum]|uniref:ANTAR domain-containing protein n=1 Tax=Candidatus Eisenbergiella merdipullorum TaxID=2838553 RepID=A0A9D2L0B8_9FIRM|nr:ANTAR domain-containing protein [Candidatus Eisenbergiella merdipullorum]
MTNIIVAFPKPENAKSIRNVLVRNGFTVTAACTTGAQALSQLEDYNEGIVVCSFRLVDMVCMELYDCLPKGMEMLVVASPNFIGEVDREGIVCLSMPLKVNELISTVGMMTQSQERRKRKRRQAPRERGEKDQEAIRQAKELLMGRNRMSEDDAHRYLQKCSMDSGTNMAETARMVLAAMRY